MKRVITHWTLPLLALFGIASGVSIAQDSRNNVESGTRETLIVASGTVAMNVDMNRLNGASGKEARMETLRFQAAANSFFPIVVLNNELRGPTPGSIPLLGAESLSLPGQLRESIGRLVLEKTDWSEAHDIVVRDGKTGFVFFNIEGHQYAYDGAARSLQITEGRLLISDGFAKNLGRPADAGTVVGNISVAAKMRPIEVRKIANGGVRSVVIPGMRIGAAGKRKTPQPDDGTVAGPDVIVADLPAVTQPGSGASVVGLGIGTTSCNAGVEDLDWFQLPDTDHPVIAQNLYRMSGGTDNADRFEQIGQSWLKHAFQALTEDICGFGCNGMGGTYLGSGCSDPYSSFLNSIPSGLGSRAWVNPFTGAFPSNSVNHTGHTHTNTSHRVAVATNDLLADQNPGATYFAEGQYVTPQEYAWCQAHAGECNQFDNVSYRQFEVAGMSPFSFSPVGITQRSSPAINAWTGATINPIEPAPGNDGIGFVGYKVTNPSAGVWHYEYAVYNQNLDRAIQSFTVPLGCGVTLSNLGFHAPPQEPGWANDGTVGDAGFSSAPWTSGQTVSALTWSSETFTTNPNANAIRWGTLYNFRFDSNKPPVNASATVAFFKTGAPITVAIQAPTPDAPCSPLTMTGMVSRKVHGAAGTFDIDISSGDAVECRSGGTNGDHTFVFSFSNNVLSGNASVSVGTGSVVGSPSFSGNTMTVNVTGVTDFQKITVSLTNVTDQFAQVLPDTSVGVNMLLGDTNGNKSVSASDISQTKAAASVGTVDGTTFRRDVNANGSVNGSDVSQVKANAGHTLP